MRKHFIDNIRWITVLFLFPYHTARIFDGISPFYIKGAESSAASAFVLACAPWFMPLLFAISGISTRYALEKRSSKAYIRERFGKLFLPLISGTLLLIPVQTYYAERFHNAYAGSYLRQYLLFFTKPTDLSGYTGGFTPGQLWFLLHLFLISLASLPVLQFARSRNILWRGKSLFIIPLFLFILVFSYGLDIGGKSLGEYFALFWLGYYIVSEDSVQHFARRYCFLLSAAAGAVTFYAAASQVSLKTGIVYRGIAALASWLCILAVLGMGYRYLNFRNTLTSYLSGASFAFYLFHQSFIVAAGFYVLQLPQRPGLQYLLIAGIGFLGSMLSYEFCIRFRLFRFLFGLKARN